MWEDDFAKLTDPHQIVSAVIRFLPLTKLYKQKNILRGKTFVEKYPTIKRLWEKARVQEYNEITAAIENSPDCPGCGSRKGSCKVDCGYGLTEDML